MQSFQQDCVELALEKFRRGEISRRGLMAGLAALGAAAALPDPAQAQAAQRLVMVNWGGIANQGFGNNYGKPFEAANPGVTVVQDSTGPSAGRIRSMVESGRVTWDLCDSSATSAFLLGGMNLLNPVDYSVVDRANVIGPTFALEHGAAPYSFSSVLVYDSSKFATAPTGWADFWDLQKFPGTRLLRRDAAGALDAAQMALGKDIASLYPLDIRACLAKVREIRRSLVFWTSGSESEQFIRTGEAVMGQIWHTRAKVLEAESNGRFKFIWNQGILQPGIFVSPRGNPGGALAQRLLASMLANAAGQVELLKLMGNGPTNPNAAALVPEEFKKYNPTEPANARVQVAQDGRWWGQNYAQANADYIDMVTG
ncbi:MULTISPECIES: extracellular solute-binding protein [Roseomonadaceae]|uniref:Extracellular solute-binding protein n=1 Tax=Falsiroseomonas oleicola TaxID=2801474 RepID=A0ABS6HHM7_9PROT|nr:extracellular solute-binding protein [Roseomonas oleicola]MBU8546775.1 extracellular solute-binding protein [Roseomonas oleicola]